KLSQLVRKLLSVPLQHDGHAPRIPHVGGDASGSKRSPDHAFATNPIEDRLATADAAGSCAVSVPTPQREPAPNVSTWPDSIPISVVIRRDYRPRSRPAWVF